MKVARTIALALFALAAAGCSEKPQTASTAKKTDAKGYELAASSHVADGWKGGDKTAWDSQLRARAQRGQDEYPRSHSPTAAAPATVAAAASAAPVPKAP